MHWKDDYKIRHDSTFLTIQAEADEACVEVKATQANKDSAATKADELNEFDDARQG